MKADKKCSCKLLSEEEIEQLAEKYGGWRKLIEEIAQDESKELILVANSWDDTYVWLAKDIIEEAEEWAEDLRERGYEGDYIEDYLEFIGSICYDPKWILCECKHGFTPPPAKQYYSRHLRYPTTHNIRG